MQLLVQEHLEEQHADADGREIGQHHRAHQVERRDQRAQQHHQRQQHDDQRHDDDETDVALVVVAGVPQRGGKATHRDRRVGQRGVGLRAAGDVADDVDLVHRLRAERIQLGLHQVARRSTVRGQERLGGLLELHGVEHLGGNVETGHRRTRRLGAHRQQERRGLIQAGRHHLDLLDELIDAARHLPAAVGQPVGAVLHVGQPGPRTGGRVQPQVGCGRGQRGERVVELVHGGGQALAVVDALQLAGQLVDLVDATVVAGGDHLFELGAGLDAGRVGVTHPVALQRREHRSDPGEHVAHGAEVDPHRQAQLVDAVD